MPLHLYDLTALDDADLSWKAIVFLTSHPLRSTDEVALNAYEGARADTLAAEVQHAERVWLVTDAAHHPKALLALRRFGSVADDGLMWAVVHPDLEKPMEDLFAAIAPALSQMAALRPALWAWKSPADRPEALPRLDGGRGDALVQVGPEPTLGSTSWLDSFRTEALDLSRGAALHA